MKDDYTTNSHYLTYTFLFRTLGECTFRALEWKGWRIAMEKTDVDCTHSTKVSILCRKCPPWVSRASRAKHCGWNRVNVINPNPTPTPRSPYLDKPARDLHEAASHVTVHGFLDDQHIDGRFGPGEVVFRRVNVTVEPSKTKQASEPVTVLHVRVRYRGCPAWLVSCKAQCWATIVRLGWGALITAHFKLGRKWLTLSLPRVIDFKFLLRPYQKYYITQHGELCFS